MEVFVNFINHLYQVSSPWSPNPIVNGGDLWISIWISSYERIFLWSSYYLKYLLVFDLFVTFYIFIDYKYKINKNSERERERERERSNKNWWTIKSFLLSRKPILIGKLNLIHSPLYHMNFENLSFNSIDSQKDTLNCCHKQIQIVGCFSEKPITFGTIVGNWKRHSF